jgi:hypothetical protein
MFFGGKNHSKCIPNQLLSNLMHALLCEKEAQIKNKLTSR